MRKHLNITKCKCCQCSRDPRARRVRGEGAHVPPRHPGPDPRHAGVGAAQVRPVGNIRIRLSEDSEDLTITEKALALSHLRHYQDTILTFG